MESLWQDLRFSGRMLLKKPGFTLIAVITLALGIGANTAIFSVVNAVLLRSLPLKDPQQLVSVTGPNIEIKDNQIRPDLNNWRAGSQAVTDAAAYVVGELNLTGGAQPERIVAAQVSANFLALLGINPAQGRHFLAEEDQPGRNRVVVMSDNLWRRRFGGDAALLGKTITINGESVTVVGMMPRGFAFPEKVEAWIPLGFGNDTIFSNVIHYHTIARLGAGFTLAQARVELETVAQHAASQQSSARSLRIEITPLQRSLVSDVRTALLVLLGAVSFVLLIACANVANLLLAQAAGRQQEFAVRVSLGAGRWRLIRQLLVESALLALIGGTLGLLLAMWGVDLLITISPVNLPGAARIGIDGGVLGFSLLLSLMTAVVFGLAPAWQASKVSLVETLKEASPTAAGSLRRHRLRSLLTIVEIAFSLVLLVGAGLLLKSFVRLQQVELGFQPQNVLTMELSLLRYKYEEGHQISRFYQQVFERLAALPSVQSIGGTSTLPFSNTLSACIAVTIEGRAMDDSAPMAAGYRVVTPDYFRALGIPLRRGRAFTAADTQQANRTVIINDAFARRYLSNEDPIGKRLTMDERPPQVWLEIVGVVGDVKHFGLSSPAETEMYLPHAQQPLRSLTLVIRAAIDPRELIAAARSQVLAVDPEQPVATIKTMDQRVAESLSAQRFNLLLMALFAALAIVLAAIGIYGVTSYSVMQRTHEIGIRVALGAQQRDVLKLVVGQGMKLALVGMVIGLSAAVALTRLLQKLLFEVSATDPVTFAVIALLLMAVALLACYIPARRATKVDPMVALRYE